MLVAGVDLKNLFGSDNGVVSLNVVTFFMVGYMVGRLKIEIFFSIVVADILNDLTYQIKIFRYFPFQHFFSEQVTKYPSEIFMSWIG